MPSVYAQSATNLGGSCHEFEQTVYINATGWGAADPNARRGALTRGTGLRGGVCMALSALYVASRGDWSVFKNAMVSPGGLAHVRGLMNFHNESDRVGSINFDNLSNIYVEYMRLFGVQYSGQQRNAQNGDAANGVIGFVRQDGLYFLSYWGGFGGHSVAFAKTSNTFKVFDPNYGEANLPSSNAFSAFVTWWLPSYYAGINRWMIQRYYL